MKKWLLFIVLFLLVNLHIINAEIDLETDEKTYNLGNKIRVSASALLNYDFDGLLELSLNCDDYNFQYFLTPISLESDFRSAIIVPEIKAASSMLGNCKITSSLTSNKGLLIEKVDSEGFFVTHKLNVIPSISIIEALPSESITISGFVNEATGKSVMNGTVKIDLGQTIYDAEVIEGFFTRDIKLLHDIKSGQQIVTIRAFDLNNNLGLGKLDLYIEPVPKFIELEIGRKNFLPGEILDFIPKVYDQAGDIIPDELEIDFIGPIKKIFRKESKINELFSYELNQYAEAGKYTLTSTYKNLTTKADIMVKGVNDVKIKYLDEKIIVENIGNLPFNDKLTFFLQGKSINYSITRNVKLDPGNFVTIDLSKEVMLGVYDIMAPIRKGIEPIKDSFSNQVSSFIDDLKVQKEEIFEGQGILAGDVKIHDNRPFYKKIGTGLTSISGMLVGADGFLTKKPFLAPILLVFILLVIVFRYGRKSIYGFKRRAKNSQVQKIDEK
jgi:hypothetical protein